MLSAKCLQLCIAYNKPAEAAKAALSFANATESTPGLHKVARALAAFKTYAAEEKAIQEEHGAALSALFAKYPIDGALATAKSGNMVYAHEMLKHDSKNADLVINALEKDPENSRHVFLAERTHKRLVSAGKDDVAKAYFAKATATYKYSTYFEGELKDTK